MNSSNTTIRMPERKRSKSNRKSMRSSTSALSMFVAALLFTSPSSTSHESANKNEPTIRYWAAEAMSPQAELTAAAAAAVVRRNVISGAAIFTVGDAAAQMLTQKKQKKIPVAIAQREQTTSLEETKSTIQEAKTNGIVTAVSNLDMNRLCSSTVLGAVWSGFCVPFIYGSVEKTFPGKANFRQILIKVLVTCSILSTIGNWITMFARRFAAQYTTYQFDRSSSLRLKWCSKPIESLLLFVAIFKGCFKSCNRDIMEVIIDDIKIWPLYDLTCYSLIPPTWRPITTSIMSSGWAMYMSVVSAKEDQEEEMEDAPSVASTVSTIEPPAPKPQQTIQVTPLNPFPNKVASPETTKRLIGVKGGEALKNNLQTTSDSDDDHVESA